MNNFETVKSDLLQINNELLSLCQTADTIPGIPVATVDKWENTCRSIEKQVNEEIVRIAVVGSIKSGKSTFVNSILEGDYLKRGAGIVTSIVTKIRKGSRLKASLFFKTWEEINNDMRQAMVLFPSEHLRPGDEKFDIRREQDRDEFTKALTTLNADQLISNDSFNVNGILLASYLKGYARINEMISFDTKTHVFEDSFFMRYKDFAGDDSLAIFLKDLELEIPAEKFIHNNIEIADCQGSDSPNPLHLSMIQDYLLQAHLIIYIISSRTGIRQADIKFLTMLKKMGLMGNILFVLNCDFNEHEDLNDLKSIIERLKEELAVIRSGTEVFTFSALYDLFRQFGEKYSQKDKLKMKQWENDRELSSFSEQETNRFLNVLSEKINKDRLNLLLKNHIERLLIISAGMLDLIKIYHDLLLKNAEDVKIFLEKIDYEQAEISQMESIIKNTIDGTLQKVKQELGNDVDRFFDIRYGNIIKSIQEFVRQYNSDYQKNKEDLMGMGFSTSLYMVFQEFKHALDSFMIQIINPQLIQFVQQEETKIIEILNKISASYINVVRSTLQRYEESLRTFDITLDHHSSGDINSIDLDIVKKGSGLMTLPLVPKINYTSKIRLEATLRLSFYRILKVFKKLLPKKTENEMEGGIEALRDGLNKIKQETEKSIIFHLSDYKENLKYQHLFKLADIATNYIHEMLLTRFSILTTDMSGITAIAGNEQVAKEKALEILKSMEKRSTQLSDQILQLKGRINS